MSDIRFNNWYHQSGTGGVYQDGSGNVGIGTSVPTSNLDVAGTVTATTFVGNVTGNLTGNVTGNVTGDVTGNLTGDVTGNATGISTTQITVGETFIKSNSISIGTTTTAGRNAGLSTAIGTLIYNTDVGLQMYNGSQWQTVKSGYSASGGAITTNNDQTIHTFTGAEPFVVSGGTIPGAKILVVGGGGGGIKGGGGGGGVVYKDNIDLPTGTYAIEVGGGGATSGSQDAAGGGRSSFIGQGISYKGYGGGCGLQAASKKSAAHPDGFYGSGGGGGEPATPGATYATPELQAASTQTPSPVTNNLGNQGGNGGPNSVGGGGGGAGGAGANVPSGAGGAAFTSTITGASVTYAGGGGGGGYPQGGMPDSGPADPSAGSNASGHAPGSSNGTTNRGGGGGGYENDPAGGYGAANGDGGSGIVIISYPT